MWPRWNTRPIIVRVCPTPPAEVVPGPSVATNAAFIRARDAVSAPTRGRCAVSHASAAELPWGRANSVDTGVVRPLGRPPPGHQAPSEAPRVRQSIRWSNPVEVVPLLG